MKTILSLIVLSSLSLPQMASAQAVCHEPAPAVHAVWVAAAYQTVYDRVWVPPVYGVVADRVWREPIVVTDYVNVLVPAVCNPYFVPAHLEQRSRQRIVRYGFWETVTRQVVVTPGYYATTARNVLIRSAHWAVLATD